MDFATSVQYSIFAYVLMAIIAMLAAVMVRGIVVVLQSTQKKKQLAQPATPVSVSVAPARDETAAHVAAVAAAVYAVLGAHRLVHIGEVGRTPAWQVSGRAAHHTSHQPRRTGR